MPFSHRYALPPTHRIEEYEVVRVLGTGGFGITYLAFDHELDGPVALKEYFPRGIAARRTDWFVVAASTSVQEVFAWGKERFIDEARAIHRFHHHNVVRAHRYLEAHGTAYIVMEYVEGESLEALLKARGQLTPERWRPWLEQLLDGLAHVHQHGYLHRDIKPENIVVRAEDNQAVLIDFGAARIAASERAHTRVFTAQYAPIEQHTSRVPQGPPADIYSLAAVAHRALTGSPPPGAPDRLLADQYVPLTERIIGADRAWLGGIDRSLAVRPEDRPQSVEAWRREMSDGDTAVPHGGGTARASDAPPLFPAVPEAPVKTSQTHRNTIIIALGILAVTIVGILWLRRPDPAPGRSSERPWAMLLEETPTPLGGAESRLPPAVSIPQPTVPGRDQRSRAAQAGSPEPEAAPGEGRTPPPASAATALGSDELFALHTRASSGDSAALARLVRAAEGGHPEAQTTLGWLNFEGTGLPQSDERAFTWFARAAVQGQVEGQAWLGMMHYLGRGVPQDYAEALVWLTEAAMSGNEAAQFLLGKMHADGEGVRRNSAAAVEWYRKASNQGLAEAQFALANLLEEGDGVVEDDASAASWYRSAAEQGHAEAQYALGVMLGDGIGVAQDMSEAADWYRAAAEQGHAAAQFAWGLSRDLDGGDDLEAVKWYGEAATQGHTEAQYFLGRKIAEGQGVPRDTELAAEWYRAAAENGHLEAQYALAGLLEKDENAVDASRWYRRAADQGHASAQLRLGRMYLSGAGITRDDEQAEFWIRKAADQGVAAAALELGTMYYEGIAVPKDHAKAVEWYRRASEQGLPEAENYLGRMYERGEGVPQSIRTALQWYDRAADRGFADALYAKGDLFDQGAIGPADPEAAAGLFRDAAVRGHLGAQYRLGVVRRDGRGVRPDQVLAHMWFSLAEAGGHTNARAQREIVERNMSRSMLRASENLQERCIASGYRECGRLQE